MKHSFLENNDFLFDPIGPVGMNITPTFCSIIYERDTSCSSKLNDDMSYLHLLKMDSNERNKIFDNFSIHHIYNLIYLSSGIYGSIIRNNSLKLLHKYIIHINQIQKGVISLYFLYNIYNFLINYEYENKHNIEILEEIDYKIYVYINLENFKNDINNNKEMIKVLNHLVNKK